MIALLKSDLSLPGMICDYPARGMVITSLRETLKQVRMNRYYSRLETTARKRRSGLTLASMNGVRLTEDSTSALLKTDGAKEGASMNRLVPILLIAGCLSACANLKEVRDFAAESAKFSTYSDLSTRFRDTADRERPYLTGANLAQEETTDKGRKEVYPELLKIHQRVGLYFKTLARLAGDETFDLSHEMATLGNTLKQHLQFGIEAKHVDSYASIGGTLSKWITSGYQQSAVREMVRKGDPDIQVLLGGMGDLVRLYRKTHAQEKRIVLGFFEVEIPLRNSPQDSLLATLAKTHLQAKTMEYRLVESKYDDAERGITKIMYGHKALADNVNNVSASDLATSLQGISNDIRVLGTHIQTLHN